MDKKKVKNVVEYWKKSAKRDLGTMKSLFDSKRYVEALFFGHLVLEKILKGLVVEETKGNSPHTHDLIMLTDLSGLEFSQEDKDFFRLVSRFNIRARYPDYRFKIHQAYRKKNTEEIIREINKFYRRLCQELKAEK